MAYYEMSFANHNILDIALSLIPPTVVQIRKNEGTKVNKYGQTEASYSEWIEVYGIVQPGGEQNEHTNGVDFSKKRVTIWLRGISLDGTHILWAPDQIRYVGCIYNVVGVKDWYPYDNYKECECVEAMNLGANQRNVKLPDNGTAKKTSSRRKTRDDANQQTLNFDVPQEVSNPESASVPPRRPSIFTADSTSVVNTDTNAQGNDTARQTIETQVQPPNPHARVGKAKIKF